MRLPGFLRRDFPMHPEHIEHNARHRTIRLGASDMSDVTIVVRCGRVGKLRFVAAMALMRLAARLGGFKKVQLAR